MSLKKNRPGTRVTVVLLFIGQFMNLQEILKAVNENTLAVAKALQEWDTDQAVDLLTKHAEAITQRIEKSEDVPGPDDNKPELPEETPVSPKEDTPPSETPPTEPIEKKETIKNNWR